jgi:tetratricopeptide (TPR) repeat protein
VSQLHPSAGALHRFMLGELPEREMRSVLRHLLARCPRCRQATAPLWVLDGDGPGAAAAEEGLARGDGATYEEGCVDAAAEEARFTASARSANPENPATLETAENPDIPENPDTLEKGPADDDYDAVFDRVFAGVAASERAVRVERAQGRELAAELLQHLPAHQRMLVANSPRFRNRFLAELLLAESHEACSRDPEQALGFARLALEVASRLDERSCGGAELLNGLQARAWAQIGNALRIGADHPGAEAAFASAEALCGRIEGAGLLDRARVLDLEASLRKDQRRFGQASRLLDRVITIYEKLGQSHLLGRALSQKATLCGEAGQTEAEIVFLRHALELLDPDEDARAFLNARHNLIVALHESGRSREAFALLFNTRPLYLKLGDRMSLVRLRWLEGRVALGLDRVRQAEAAFREVLGALGEMGRDYDAAGAALDLAKTLALQGRTAELRRLAEQMLAALETRAIHGEALAALACFWTAAAREQASLALAGEVAGFLDLARDNPDLHFVRRAGRPAGSP